MRQGDIELYISKVIDRKNLIIIKYEGSIIMIMHYVDDDEYSLDLFWTHNLDGTISLIEIGGIDEI